MKRARIVIPMKVAKRNKAVLEDPEGVEVGNRLADPEFVVGNARHDLVADRRRSVVAACGIEIPSQNQWILLFFHNREQCLHLPQPACRGTLVFQVRRDHRGSASRQVGYGKLRDERHSASAA